MHLGLTPTIPYRRLAAMLWAATTAAVLLAIATRFNEWRSFLDEVPSRPPLGLREHLYVVSRFVDVDLVVLLLATGASSLFIRSLDPRSTLVDTCARLTAVLCGFFAVVSIAGIASAAVLDNEIERLPVAGLVYARLGVTGLVAIAAAVMSSTGLPHSDADLDEVIE